jgi:hypothetical protein
MSQTDNKLSALLKQWRDIEPQGNFEANVWRRIRTTDAPTPERLGSRALWQRWLAPPAWAVATAVAIAAAIGAWGGLRSAPQAQPTAPMSLTFLTPDTLAGGYVQVVRGE